MKAPAAVGAAASPPICNGQGVLDKFHVAALTFQRARQLHHGARPRMDPVGHKHTRVALLEVMAGTISWDVS